MSGSAAASATGADTRPARGSAVGSAPVYRASISATAASWPGSAGATSSTCPPVLAFSSSGVPVATTRPWSMTTTSLARWSASSRYWVVSKTVTPSAASSRISAHTSPRLCGSRPVLGSSRYKTWGRPTRLAARSSRRRMPPEYVFTGRPAASDSSNRSSRLAARARASARPMPSSRPIMIRLFVPLRPSSTDAYCPVRAMSWRTRCASRTTSYPATLARPPSGRSRVARIRTAVVFPAPLGPSRPSTVPVRAARSAPASAVVLPKRLTSPSASIAYIIAFLSCVAVQLPDRRAARPPA